MKTLFTHSKKGLSKKITILALLVSCMNTLYSQGCAVKTTDKDFQNALTINRLMASEKTNRRALLTTRNAVTRKKIIIPYISHIITRADGTGGISIQKINEGIQYANDFFKNLNIEFKEYQSPNYINSDRFYDFIMSEEYLITDTHEVDQVLNLYFANSISNSNGGTYCGYAYFPDPNNLENDLDRIFMDTHCMGGFPETTFVHEIGHYLDLFHTHENYRGNEYVNGSNCSTAGDLICDTPADPQLSYSKVDFDCNYTAAETDVNGDYYTPNTNNVMSYSRHHCRTELTPMQLEKARFTAENYRIDLKEIPTINQSPYNGIAQVVPGTVEMEFYDLGGQGVSYNDKDTGNNGNYLRTDDVDMYNGIVAWIQKDEWIEYTINIQQTGLYTLTANVASITNNNSFSLSVDGNTIGQSFNVPNTNDWGDFEEISQSNISLTAGTNVLRFETTTGRFNIDKISFNLTPSTTPQSPYNGIAQVVPGTVEMEFYDLGGQGVAYNDKDTGNNGNYLRTDDVDMYSGIVAWIQKDEWIEYTIDIQQTGLYNFSALASSIFDNKTFQLSIDGIPLGQDFTVPNTSSWENFQFINQNTISLTAGQKILRLTSLSGGFNIDKVTITAANTSSTATSDLSLLYTKSNIQTVSTYPNPVDSNVTVNAPDYISKIILHNSTGNFVASFNGTSNTSYLSINLNTLKKGTYIATIFTEKEVYKSNIVKD